MKAKHLLRLLVSAGLIALLIATVDVRGIASGVGGAEPAWLAAAFALALLDRLLMAYKWNVLLRAKGINLPLSSITATYWASTFLGVFLPATVGADALRAYATSRESGRTSDIVSSIVVERVLGLLALLAFGLAGVMLSALVIGQGFAADRDLLLAPLLGALVVVGVVFVVSLSDQAAGLFRQLVARGAGSTTRPGRAVARLAEVYFAYHSFRNRPLALAVFLGLSLIENLLIVAKAFYVALAFGVVLPLLVFFILVPVVLVLVRLPISIDGFGVQELTYVYFLSRVGVTSADAFLIGLTGHLLALASLVPGGVIYWLRGLGGRAAGTGAGTLPAALTVESKSEERDRGASSS